MKLEDYLKVKKVRCVGNRDMVLTENKYYPLIGLTDQSVMIFDDDGFEIWASMTRFEPVLDDINTVANTDDLHSEFKVGDPVYLPNQAGGKILKIQDNKACHYPFFVDVVNTVNNSLYELDSNGKTKYGNFTDVAIKATIENHALLTQLYPHIEFEQPPKPLTGSDLCRAMLEKGWKYVPCYTSNESENKATTGGVIRFIKMVSIIDGAFINNHLHHYKYAIPFDPRTGELLTEYVLK